MIPKTERDELRKRIKDSMGWEWYNSPVSGTEVIKLLDALDEAEQTIAVLRSTQPSPRDEQGDWQ